jgi:hypothetical protein
VQLAPSFGLPVELGEPVDGVGTGAIAPELLQLGAVDRDLGRARVLDHDLDLRRRGPGRVDATLGECFVDLRRPLAEPLAIGGCDAPDLEGAARAVLKPVAERAHPCRELGPVAGAGLLEGIATSVR